MKSGLAIDLMDNRWWLGDRRCLKIWRRASAHDWRLVFTIRWRSWTCRYDPHPTEERSVTRGRRGVFLGNAGFPDGFGSPR